MPVLFLGETFSMPNLFLMPKFEVNDLAPYKLKEIIQS